MICLDNTDVIEGGASVDAVVDYSLHGLVGTTFTQLAAGVMNTTLTAVLYTAGAAISVVSIILVNKHTSAVDITLCLDPANGGNPRYLIPKTISLGAGYSLHTDGARLTIIDASGGLVTGVNVSDTTYAAGWNGETKVAPSKNAVYDKIQTILGDVTAAANITDNAVVVGDGGAKGVKSLALGAAVQRSYLIGLTLSNDTDTEHDIAIAVGTCRDSANAYAMTLATILTKRIDAAWAVGDDNGGLFTGAVANSTWYHLFLIRKDSDGTIDAGFDTSVTAANKPAGYSNYRRIGSVFTNGSANILNFSQIGNTVMWDTPIEDIADLNPGTNAVTRTLSTPLGIVSETILYIGVSTDQGYTKVHLSPLTATDEAPSISKGTIYTEVGGSTFAQARILTNISSQIRSRITYAVGSNTLIITTLGYVDRRGRDD